MIRAVLDANVLISAAVRPSGPPGQIAFALLSHQAFQLIISPAIELEVRAAFAQARIRRYFRDSEAAFLWVADIVAIADVVQDAGRVIGVCRDPADDMVLAAAIEGRADILVTGDFDLLTLGEHDGVAIVSPRVFLSLLET